MKDFESVLFYLTLTTCFLLVQRGNNVWHKKRLQGQNVGGLDAAAAAAAAAARIVKQGPFFIPR